MESNVTPDVTLFMEHCLSPLILSILNLTYFPDFIFCSITACSTGFYGIQCNAICTCMLGATCNAVDGDCTCNKAFEEQDCDKGMCYLI